MIEIKLGENRTVTHKVTTVTKDNVNELVKEYNYKTEKKNHVKEDLLSNNGVARLVV